MDAMRLSVPYVLFPAPLLYGLHIDDVVGLSNTREGTLPCNQLGTRKIARLCRNPRLERGSTPLPKAGCALYRWHHSGNTHRSVA